MSLKTFDNVDLRSYNTFLIGGKAKRLVVAADERSLIEAVSLPRATVLGRGSNVLIGDGGISGTAVINRYEFMLCDGDAITVGSGMTLSRLSRIFYMSSLGGAEWAAGIPGTVGGAVVMNAGAFGGCMADIVTKVRVLRGGKVVCLDAEECAFTYRGSAIASDDTVLSVSMRGQASEQHIIAQRMKEYRVKRRRTQPQGFCAGSVFRAADKPAAVYIDGAGLKGMRVGDAQISEKHANFIINRGFASAADVVQLMAVIKAVVFDKYGKELTEEIRFIGEF